MIKLDDALDKIAEILQKNNDFRYLYNYSFKQIDVFGPGTIKDNFNIDSYVEEFTSPIDLTDYCAQANSDYDFCVGVANATIALTFLVCLVDKFLDYLSIGKNNICGFTYVKSESIDFDYDGLAFDLVRKDDKDKRIEIYFHTDELCEDIITRGAALKNVLKDYTGVFKYTLDSEVSAYYRDSCESCPFNTISTNFVKELKQSIKNYLYRKWPLDS